MKYLYPLFLFLLFSICFSLLSCSKDGSSDDDINSIDSVSDSGSESGSDFGTESDSSTSIDTASDSVTGTIGTDTGDASTSTDTQTDTTHTTDEIISDADSDGWSVPLDCDDNAVGVHPSAAEIVGNQIDDDCDGVIDEVDTEQNTLHDWDMYLTCDNQIHVYFGTPVTTTGAQVGEHKEWQTEGHFTATGRAATDYMYVVTASDQATAQGFIGVFTNTTLGRTTTTADTVWEVFAAGAHPETNPYCTTAPCIDDQAWPKSTFPTQEEVDVAISFAEANSLWVTPYSHPDYDRDDATPMTEFGTYWWGLGEAAYPNIPVEARWIWHDSGRNPDNAQAPGAYREFNHDEFLVFRIKGTVPQID